MSLIPQHAPVIVKLADNTKAFRVLIAEQPIGVSFSPLLPSGFTSISSYGNVTSVAASTLTDIHTYTVPVGKTLVLSKIEVSGQNASDYQIDIGGSIHGVKRTYYSEFNESFDFDRFEIAAGTTIKIQVEHDRPDVSDYDARIIGIEG